MAKGRPNPFSNDKDPQSMEELTESLKADKDTPAGEIVNLDRRRFCKMLGALAAVAGASVVGCGRSLGYGPEGCEGCDSGVEGCHVGPEGCDGGVEGCDAGPEGCEPEGCNPEGCNPEGCRYFA